MNGKCKIWHKGEKKWLEDCFIDQDGVVYPSSKVASLVLTRWIDNVEICYYTERKDKNGKLIYSGNIVKVHKSHKEIRDVIFYDYAWVTRKIYKGKDEHTSLYCLSKYETYEIIGNVQEHSHLLKNMKGGKV